jgi:hypothetical protein
LNNFTPDNTQEPTLFNGTVTCTVTATTPQGRQSDSSSLPMTIWNGCDVGVEPWDHKILRDGAAVRRLRVLLRRLVTVGSEIAPRV